MEDWKTLKHYLVNTLVFFAVVHLFCGGHDDLVEEGHDERRKRGSRQHAEYHADADGTAA